MAKTPICPVCREKSSSVANFGKIDGPPWDILQLRFHLLTILVFDGQYSGHWRVYLSWFSPTGIIFFFPFSFPFCFVFLLLSSVASFPFDAILTTMCRSMFRLPDARAALTDDQMNPETIHDTDLFSCEALAAQLEHVSTSV